MKDENPRFVISTFTGMIALFFETITSISRKVHSALYLVPDTWYLALDIKADYSLYSELFNPIQTSN